MSGWLKFLLLIVLLVVGSILAVNAATYNKIANEGETVGDVSPGGARFLMWINIILCVIVFVAALWWFYVEYFATSEQLEKIEAAKKAAYEYAVQTGQALKAENFAGARSVNMQSPRAIYRNIRGSYAPPAYQSGAGMPMMSE
jgi:hypothetical protein